MYVEHDGTSKIYSGVISVPPVQVLLSVQDRTMAYIKTLNFYSQSIAVVKRFGPVLKKAGIQQYSNIFLRIKITINRPDYVTKNRTFSFVSC